ncbi:MAG: FecR domain-containing protein, partial [Robiginitalea sp.]|uniref:FecR family protein n=1 Tax=Robiginitalea sp. TaxID=1902411 RepID=UPI003C71A3CB
MDENDLIRKWLSGELSPEESEAFEALEEAYFYREIISDAAAFKAPGLSGGVDSPMLGKRLPEDHTPQPKRKWVRPLMRIASVLVLGLAMYYLLFQQNLVRVETGVGEKTTITLPDASSVALNALTEISFNESKWEDNREVQLEGEAFFDVAKGATFVVATSGGSVSVLGTEFNVRQRGKVFEVRCFEGEVKVVSGSHTAVLREGDNFRISDGVVTTGENMDPYPRWTRNTSHFQRVPMSEVFAELQRQYDVEVLLEDVVTEQLFTGGFIHGNLELALKSVTEPMGLSYSINNDNEV